MKTRKHLCFLVVLMFLSAISTVWAQKEEQCGAEPPENYNRFMLNRLQSITRNRALLAPVSLPVQHHVSRNSNGSSPSITSAKIKNVMDELNATYAPMNISFYEYAPIKYIDNSSWNSSFNKSSDSQLTQYEEAKAINVFYFSNVKGSSSSICGFAKFPGTGNRVILKVSCSQNGSTASHELGHYFSILHTHSTSNGRELVKRTNCSRAGDFFCDTPADPKLSNKVNSNCKYTGSSKDSNGDAYQPDTRNVMSYTSKPCRTGGFTSEQQNAITTSLKSDRAYLLADTNDKEAPSIPTGLKASNTTANSTNLSWKASTDNIGVAEYEIFQDSKRVGTSTVTNFSVSGLSPNTRYSFTVKAKDAAGNISKNSSKVSITTSERSACTGISSLPYTESFENGIGAWTQETNDAIDWTRKSGATKSKKTGPSEASDRRYYIYTEATKNYTKIALLTSPCIDLSNQPNSQLSFDYHMYGSNMGTMEFRASTDNGITWKTIWSKKGDQGNNWKSETISLSNYGGSIIKLQLKGTTGSSYRSDMAIDNLKITSTALDNQSPTVPTNLIISNITSTSIDLSWNASTDNTDVIKYDVYQEGVLIGSSVNTTYNVSGLTANTEYSFTVKAKDATGNSSGNSNTASITTSEESTCTGISSFPYSESFENGIGAWIQETNDAIDWTRKSKGTKSKRTGPSEASNKQYYIYTEATRNYTKIALLTSPCIDLSNQPNSQLSFDYHMYGSSMGTMEFRASTDNGITWKTIWNKKGDQGNNWKSETVSLSNYGGSVIKLQLKGTTGSSYRSDMAIDNLKIISVVPDTEIPTVPTDLTASNIRNTSVDLSWNASTDNTGVTGYDIYQGGISIGSSTNTTYSVHGLTANTGYSFTIKAKDAAGNTSGNSNTVNITTTNTVQYTLNIKIKGQGIVSGGGNYNSGEVATVKATPSTGWEFGGWTGDLSVNTNPSSITMDVDKTVTATFTETPVISTSTEKYRLTWRGNTATTMVIGWNQVRGTNPVVYYGITDFGSNYTSYPLHKAVDRTVSSKGMNNNYARLTGLQADTAYYFVIKDSEGVSKRFWFKTAPSDPNTRLSIIAGGDSRNNRTPRKNANRLVAKIRPHAVFFGGDMTSSSSSSQWQNWFDDWQLTIGSDGRIIPVVAARGNHEKANDIRDLFDIPTAAGGEYYALSFAGNLVRTYTLNTEVSPAGTQGKWLANDLTTNSANHTWAIAQYHRATRPHEPGKSEQNDQYEAWSKPFYTNAVQLVMESDSHVVKRTWPIKPSTGSGSDEGFVKAATDPQRAVYVGEGCWGAPLRNASDTKKWTRASGSFNQFKWLWIDNNKIELRTIKVDNASSVGQLSDTNIFVLPTNIDVWNPTGGSVVTIDNPHKVNATLPRTNIVSIKNNTAKRKLNLYPNPIEFGMLHIKYHNYTNTHRSEALIRDMFGRVVDKVIFKSETTTYNINKLNTGVYFIVIKTEKGEISEKFIKR